MTEKNQRLYIRCTEEEKERWEEAAKTSRRKVSDWARLTLDDAAELALENKSKKKK